MTPLAAQLARRILVLDGAMGTMVQAHARDDIVVRGSRFRGHAHDVRGNTDLLTLTQPQLVSAVHEAYLEAGADMVRTNTFGATRITQSDHGLEDVVYELNRDAARLARAAAARWMRQTPGRPRFVAGVIGPGSRALSMPPRDAAAARWTPATARDAYREQVRALMDGDVDCLLIETIVDGANAAAAIAAVLDEFADRSVRLPLMVSATPTDRSGRLLSGETLEQFYASIRYASPLSVGLNCGAGAGHLRMHITGLARAVDRGTAISCHPSAGLPDAFGMYDELPRDTARAMREMAEAGLVNIVGGCCGTTPAHIRAIAEEMEAIAPGRR